ncbi:MAG: hypothetical protein IIW02_03225 [Clostridia bacterium]|nr:hypothetical protein [Clostridia bacterium]
MNMIMYFISVVMYDARLVDYNMIIAMLFGGAIIYFVAQLLINLFFEKRIFKLIPTFLFAVDILYFCIRTALFYIDNGLWGAFLVLSGISVMFSLIAIGFAFLISFMIKFIIKKRKDRNLAINE